MVLTNARATNQAAFRNGHFLRLQFTVIATLVPPVGSARIVWARGPPIRLHREWSPRVRLVLTQYSFDSNRRKSNPSRDIYIHFVGACVTDVSVNGRW